MFKFLAGAASILTLVSATLAALGFIVLRSHANLLGLSSFLHHSLTDYLYEGGAFFIYTFLSGLASIISTNRIWGIATLALLTLYIVSMGIKGSSDRIDQVVERIRIAKLAHQGWFQWLCILAALWLDYYCISHLGTTSGADSLLFTDSINSEVAKRATADSLTQLELHYEFLVAYFLLSIAGVLVVSWMQRTTVHRSRKSNCATVEARRGVALLLTAGRGLLYVLLVLETVLLAVSYGVNVYPNEFHKVCLQINEAATEGIILSNNAWLIREDADAFIVYFGDTKQVHRIKKEDVVNIVITERRNVFSKPDPDYDERRCLRN